MYTDPSFKKKTHLKEAVAAGRTVYVYQPGPFAGGIVNGDKSVEGPSYERHTWYARVRVENNVITKVLR